MQEKQRAFLVRTAYWAVWTALLWLGVRYLLRWLLPFILALGLADVVQAKQGGVRLDTMFIDEGFGTLDPEALNSAMNTLIDLQNTGRLVGIISHVPELEERIDARLKVTPAEKGSKAEFEILE